MFDFYELNLSLYFELINDGNLSACACLQVKSASHVMIDVESFKTNEIHILNTALHVVSK